MGKKKAGKFILPQGTQEEIIVACLKHFKLEASVESYRFIASKIQEKHGTIDDFLEALLKHEASHDEEKRINRWLAQGKFFPLTTIEDFEFDKQPSIDPVLIHELASCRFIEEGQSVIFLGPPGVGKTHLSIALGYEAIKAGYTARCMKLNEFFAAVEDDNKKKAKTGKSRLFDALVNPKLLVLDDIDYYTSDADSGKFLFDVLKHRYETKSSIIITSNRNPMDWGNLFGTKERTKASLDRIFDERYRRLIEVQNGRSYRVPKPLSNLTIETKELPSDTPNEPGVLKKITTTLSARVH